MRFIHFVLVVLIFMGSVAEGIGKEGITANELLQYAVAPDTEESEEEPSEESDDNTLQPHTYNLGTREFARDTAIGYSALWVSRFFYVRNKNSRMFNTSLSSWWDNITQLPQWDDGDSAVTNLVTHPLVGSMYFLFYREMGHEFWSAALGSFVLSTLFEYTVEGMVETPSLQDLVFTPLLGVPLGYGMEVTSDWLVDTGFVPAKILGHIVNPVRNFVSDRHVGVYNPLSKNFMSVSGPLIFNANKDEAINLAYPFYLEPALPVGRFMTDMEIVNLKEEYGGEFIFYSIRVDVPSKNQLWGLYVQIAQAGVNEVTLGEEKVKDGFEFANLLFGGKAVLGKSDNAVISGGLDLIIPTSYKDNLDRLQTLLLYKRNFPLHLQKAWTVTPYVSAAAWKGIFNIQGTVSTDYVLRAENLEGDDFEFRLNYGASMGINFPVVASPVVFAEFTGYSALTAKTFEKNDLFVTSGVRLGRKFSPGIAIQVPISGPDAQISTLTFLMDLQVRF